jgi:conjugal transfer pilus assembly protein TraE
MKIKDFSRELETRAGIGRYAQVVNIVLLLVVLGQSFALILADRTHRETIVPPTITKSFWVDGENVSPSYLEQMGQFILQLALNRSPQNAESQINELLKYVAPSSYAELKKQLMVEVERQKEDLVSTVFYPGNISVMEETQAVLIEGSLNTWVSDKLVKTENKKYLIKFGYQGRIYIEEIKDVTNEKDPWNPAVDEAN